MWLFAKKAKNFKDLTGQTFNRLTVIGRGENTKNGKAQWICLCECGQNSVVTTDSLKRGHTKSCGCLNKENLRKNTRTHGMSSTPEYEIWKTMKRRCHSETKTAKYYRDRGIKVCDRWLESFENFYSDMGPRPTANHSIERIDNDGDYCPENCKWGTAKEQNNNTRRNVRMTLNGETKTMAEWSEVLGISQGVIGKRKRKGWSDKDTLTTPVKIN